MAARKTAKRQSQDKAKANGSGQKLYTLTEIGQMASVSMPTLQKYKRNYQDRIPSVGEGRKQRYPREAVQALREIKKENLAKRGRPPKSTAAKKTARKRAAGKAMKVGHDTVEIAAAASKPASLLTLTEISRRTKISYPTVSRYVKLFLDRIPHVGSGRARRFPKEAVNIFRQLRNESRPGRPAKKASKKAPAKTDSSSSNAALGERLERLEKAQADIAKELANVVRLLKKPLQLTIKGR